MKASDNQFPKVILTEQGSTPSNPSTGDQKLYLRTSDHHLCRVDQTGTVKDIEAMASHSHTGADGTPQLAQANTHQSPDTDSGPTSLHHTLGAGANQAAAGNHTHTLTAAQALFTMEGVLATGSKPLRIYNATGATKTISKVFLAVNTAPTGAAIIVDIHKGGTTIFTTQSNRPQITAAAYTGYSTTIEVATWADGEYLTMEIDQVGSGTAGSDLTVHIIYS